jgi:hypothetical protein
MSRVNFDLHPAAFKAVVTLQDDASENSTSVNPRSAVNTIKPTLLILICLQLLLHLIVGSGNLGFIQETAVTISQQFLWTVHSAYLNNWLVVWLSVLSGGISGWLTNGLAQHFQDDSNKERIRTGPNFQKRWRRTQRRLQQKDQPIWRRSFGDDLVHAMETHSWADRVPASRYHNIPRPHRGESPSGPRIVYLWSEITRVTTQI